MSDLTERIISDLYDHFAQLDDTEDAPFGEYAEVTEFPAGLSVANADGSVVVRIHVEEV